MKVAIVCSIFLVLVAGQPAFGLAPEPIRICQVDAKGMAAIGEDGIPVCFVIPSQFIVAAGQFMASQTETRTETEQKCLPPKSGPNGETLSVVCQMQDVQIQKQVPRYANLFDLIVKHNVTSLVLPILEQFPPPEVLALKDAAAQYQTKIDAAKAAMLAGASGR
jgi:hypothetical protein